MADVVDFNRERGKRDAPKSFTAMKLAALDRAAIDVRLTHLDFRLFYYLASATDQETRVARRKQQVIADALAVTRRAVQIGTDRLSEFGFIAILTKDGGSYANGYVVLEKANDGSPLESAKANDGSPFQHTKANVASPLARKRRTYTLKKANVNAEKGEPPFAPIFPFNSLEIPSAARPMPDIVLRELRKRLGDDVCQSWFAKVAVLGEVDGTVTLTAPTRFVATRIATEFDTVLLDAWRAAVPSVERVVVTAPATPRAP